FDLAELLSLQQDPEAYGKALADALFHDESVRNLYARARTATDAGGSFLRVRLLVGQSALEMHALRWELLQDPETQAPLATSEKTLLSRFMLSYDWRPVKLRPKSDFKALVAVASPSDLAKYQLAEVDVEGEVDRATRSLDGIAVEVAGRDQPLTLEYLVSRLREGVDVLYLVCHGVLKRGRMPVLFLQDDAGEVARAEGEMLARMLAELQEPPRLVVLASCDSALPPQSPQGDGAGTEQGTTAGGRATAEASIAPRLAEAGVPAIVAMQGKITMKTVEKAMPVFFRELLKDGQIDRAMTVARGTVRDRPDAWMPALFLRIKRGCIWYVPGFSGVEDQFKKWKAITSSVRQGTFIPILGYDVAEGRSGLSHAIAEKMSFLHGFPMAPQDRSDLAKVTQYVSIDQSRKYARDEVLKHLHERL
ncbi:MAG: CHAT domain-containing protein, partial [bacterium]|nr:CHAT domain-containing protein [bacterium]